MTHRVACVTITFISIYVTGVMSLPFELSSAHKDLKLMRECDLYYVYTPVFTAMSIVFHLVLFLIVTFILYGRIFRVALQQNRAIAALHPDKKEAKLTLMMVIQQLNAVYYSTTVNSVYQFFNFNDVKIHYDRILKWPLESFWVLVSIFERTGQVFILFLLKKCRCWSWGWIW